MVSASGPSKSKSIQAPVFKYLPGQEAYLPEYTSIWKDIFTGNMGSPTARALQTITGEAGMREAATQRRSIAETRGMSTPARQRAVAGAGETAVKTMAGVPQEMWTKAAEYLSQFTLQQPAVGEVGYTKSGGGGGCGVCYILREANDGELEMSMRKFRDSHFTPLGFVDNGYKWMATWIVPLMKRHKWTKRVIRSIMLNPLLRVSRWMEDEDKNGYLYIPFAYMWIGVWTVLGHLCPYQFIESSPRDKLYKYPSMTSTFLCKMKEVF